MTLASIAVEEVLLLLKVGFLVLLYLFIWRVVRTASRDLRSAPQESIILAPQRVQEQKKRPQAGEGRRKPAGRLVVVTSPALRTGEELPSTRRRSSSAARPRTTSRSCATSSRRPPRPHRAAPRRRLDRGRGLDERHLRQRRASHRAPQALLRRRDPRRRRPTSASSDDARSRDRGSPTPAGAGVTTRTRTSASRRCSRSPTGWVARRRARSRRTSPPRPSSTPSAAGPPTRTASSQLIQDANRSVYERARTDASTSGHGHDDDGRARRRRRRPDRPRRRLARLPRPRPRARAADRGPLARRRARPLRADCSPEEAEAHPHRSVITRVLGTDPDVDVDAFSVGDEARRPVHALLGRADVDGRRRARSSS